MKHVNIPSEGDVIIFAGEPYLVESVFVTHLKLIGLDAKAIEISPEQPQIIASYDIKNMVKNMIEKRKKLNDKISDFVKIVEKRRFK